MAPAPVETPPAQARSKTRARCPSARVRLPRRGERLQPDRLAAWCGRYRVHCHRVLLATRRGRQFPRALCGHPAWRGWFAQRVHAEYRQPGGTEVRRAEHLQGVVEIEKDAMPLRTPAPDARPPRVDRLDDLLALSESEGAGGWVVRHGCLEARSASRDRGRTAGRGHLPGQRDSLGGTGDLQ